MFFSTEYQAHKKDEDRSNQKKYRYQHGFSPADPIDEFIELVEPQCPGNNAHPHGREDDENGVPVAVTFQIGDEGSDGRSGPGQGDPDKKGYAEAAPSFECKLLFFCFCFHGFDEFRHEFELFNSPRKKYEEGVNQKDVCRVVEYDDGND